MPARRAGLLLPPAAMGPEQPKPLAHLLQALTESTPTGVVESVCVKGVAIDAREVQPGDLFVAIRGHHTDGHLYVAEAVRRGAAAVMVESEPAEAVDVPVVRVPDTRRALAELAAAWYDRPGRHLRLVGITGSFGKTATLNMLHAILDRAGVPAGVIGSDAVGLKMAGGPHEPLLHTTPAPLELHASLARIVDAGGRICAMEVTSQGLVQHRVHGLEFALGIFTCIAPLEHRDYHGSFRRYVEAKAAFFSHLRDGAPVVHPSGDRVVCALVRDLARNTVSCGVRPGATVRIRDRIFEPERTRMVLEVRRPLPTLDGGRVEPVAIPVELRLPGRMNVRNAGLAAAAALCLGAGPAAVREGLARVQPLPRRLQFVHRGRFTVLDDAATHPEALNVLFDVIRGIRHRNLHMVTAIRGGRGPEFNRRYAESLAIWSRRCPVHRIIATSSGETVADLDLVTPSERDAFLRELRRGGVRYLHRERLDDAIHHALERAHTGDLIVLIGTQGMHAGPDIVRRWLGDQDGPGTFQPIGR